MLNFKKAYHFVLFTLSLLVILPACQDESASTSKIETVPKLEIPAENVAVSTLDEALIVFLSGDARIVDENGERVADIGESVSAGQRILTGSDGYVELQLGDLGAVRIESDTEYVLEVLSLGNEDSKASGSILSGSIIAKVKRLSRNDLFEINTPGAVCAVRGTEFMVMADISGSVTVAVNDGSVSVAPPALSGTKSNIDKDDADVIRAMMPLVGPAQELVFDKEVFKEVEAELATWAEEGSGASVELLSAKVSMVLDTPDIQQINAENAKAIEEATLSLLNFSLYDEASSNLVSLSVRTEPQDADIYFNGRPAGRGVASRVFQRGENVDIRAISSDGQTLDRAVQAGSEALVEIIFERVEEATDDEVETKETTTDASPGKSAPVEDPPVRLVVSVEPRDSVVWVDGKRAGSGRITIEGLTSESRNIRVESPGYATFERRVVLKPDTPNMSVELEANLVVNRAQLPDPAVGTPASNRQFAVLATGEGTLIAFDRSGNPAWSAETKNTGASNTSPTIVGNRVYTLGNAEFVVVDLNRGSVVDRRDLVGDWKDLYGRRVVATGNRLLLPGDSALESLDSVSRQVLSTAEIPQRSRSTPAIWNDTIIIANQQGTLIYFNTSDLSITNTVSTEATQPVAQAPSIVGDTALIAGRQGHVSAVDLAAGRVVWERPLISGEAIEIYSDIVTTSDMAYVYGDGRLFALSMNDGGESYAPINDVTAPPMVRGSYLFLCRNDGSLTIHNRRDGTLVGRIPLGENGLSRPVVLGDYILTAGAKNAIIVDPRSIIEF